MSAELRIEIDGGGAEFRSGEKLSGTAVWVSEAPAEKLEIRLFWYTRGKGEQDLFIVNRIEIASPEREGRRRFEFDLPECPYSFSGKLISLIWAVELVALPGEEAARAEITLSPSGREVLLYGQQ